MDAPDFIPDNQVPAEASATPPDFIPDNKVPQQSSPANAPDFIPDSEMPENKYSTTEQKAKTFAEGLAGPIGTAIETSDMPSDRVKNALSGNRLGAAYLAVKNVIGKVNPEEVAARAQENPLLHDTADLVGGFGATGGLPQIGSKAISGMIQMGLLSGGDEIEKSLLGHGDPSDAVASHIAGSMAAGLIGGKVLGTAEKVGGAGLKALEDAKVGNKISSWLSGLGRAALLPEEGVVSLEKSSFINSSNKFNPTSFKKGQEFYKNVVEKAPKYIGRTVAPTAGYYIGGVGGAATSVAIEQALEHIAPKFSQKYVGPAVLKAASSGSVEKLGQIVDHATTIGKGAKRISNHVENIFKVGGNKLIDSQGPSEKDREKLKEFIENGGIDQQIRDEGQQQSQQQTPQYAEGGEVNPMPELDQDNPIAKHFPEQNTLLSAAKARVSGYLNSMRPQENPLKLPFDSEHKDKSKEKSYNKALDVALNPLSVLKHVKEGTLLPHHMKDLTNMYPDLYSHLSKKLTERMMQGQLKKEKIPSYKTRQALSLFLGTSLDSTMTQPNIMAAQSVFMQQKAQQQMPQNKSSSLSKMGNSAQTAEQSRTQDLKKH